MKIMILIFLYQFFRKFHIDTSIKIKVFKGSKIGEMSKTVRKVVYIAVLS